MSRPLATLSLKKDWGFMTPSEHEIVRDWLLEMAAWLQTPQVPFALISFAVREESDEDIMIATSQRAPDQGSGTPRETSPMHG